MTDPDVARRGRVIAATRLFYLLCALILAAVLALQTFLAVQDNQRIQQNQQIQAFIKKQAIVNGKIGKDVRAGNQRIISCTTPKGACFKDGQKRTAKAIVGINEGTLRVIVAALSCQADQVSGQQELADCTARRAMKR